MIVAYSTFCNQVKLQSSWELSNIICDKEIWSRIQQIAWICLRWFFCSPLITKISILQFPVLIKDNNTYFILLSLYFYIFSCYRKRIFPLFYLNILQIIITGLALGWRLLVTIYSLCLLDLSESCIDKVWKRPHVCIITCYHFFQIFTPLMK